MPFSKTDVQSVHSIQETRTVGHNGSHEPYASWPGVIYKTFLYMNVSMHMTGKSAEVWDEWVTGMYGGSQCLASQEVQPKGTESCTVWNSIRF